MAIITQRAGVCKNTHTGRVTRRERAVGGRRRARVVGHLFPREMVCSNLTFVCFVCKGRNEHRHEREHAEDCVHRLPTVTMTSPTRKVCKNSTSHRHDGKHGEDRADDCERDRQRGVLVAMTVTFT